MMWTYFHYKKKKKWFSQYWRWPVAANRPQSDCCATSCLRLWVTSLSSVKCRELLRLPTIPFCGLLFCFFCWPPSLLPSVQICSKAFQYCWHLLPTLTLLQLREIWSFRPCYRVSGEPVTAPPVCCSAHVVLRQKRPLQTHGKTPKKQVVYRCHPPSTCNSMHACVWGHTRWYVCVCMCVCTHWQKERPTNTPLYSKRETHPYLISSHP